jgi:hypothetical protein
MGLDDIERLLRTPEHVDLSPLELKSLVALLCDTSEGTGDPRIMTIAATLRGCPVESVPLSDKTAEQLLVALAAENDDPDVERGVAPLPRADYALVVSHLARITADHGDARRDLAEQIRSALGSTSG